MAKFKGRLYGCYESLQMQQISGAVFSVKKAAEHTQHLSIKM
jgi:hypothetical protein